MTSRARARRAVCCAALVRVLRGRRSLARSAARPLARGFGGLGRGDSGLGRRVAFLA